ncbi:amino acid ABC transporter ATP-binding protein [Streptococcus sp. X16XC17]|uniref:amino acid ABC transporter ATP-binding protein n=1 Tax=unclassified Streptococcus TaxID=2608887 RepID=UPI00066FECFC|nr:MULTISPECIES: amino acid ABC transporter ATP-binding protein [unclassified Streptococcus]TCD46328.1 amino acid ABC transporter ATP-binding protein [Streptococcus sp. X16XC17]
MLKLEHWSKSFGNHKVLNNINLSVEKGHVLTIIGASGSGKSTLLRTINFLESPDSGTVHIGNTTKNVEKISKKEILDIRRQTAMVFQNYALFSKKTALENVMENLLMVKKMDKGTARTIALKNLEKVGMLERQDYYPHQLSGGQQQRVGIARALAIEPEVILFDEPTSALDPELVNGILELIQSIAHKDVTMILVTHEMNFARKVSDHVIFLEKGDILEEGTPEQLFDNPQNERTAQFIQGFAR